MAARGILVSCVMRRSAHVGGHARVVTAQPRIPQERGERGAGDDVGAAFAAFLGDARMGRYDPGVAADVG